MTATSYIIKREGVDTGIRKQLETITDVIDINYPKDFRVQPEGWTCYFFDDEVLDESLYAGLGALFDWVTGATGFDVFVLFKRFEHQPGRFIYTSRVFVPNVFVTKQEDLYTPIIPADPEQVKTERLLDGFIIG